MVGDKPGMRVSALRRDGSPVVWWEREDPLLAQAVTSEPLSQWDWFIDHDLCARPAERQAVGKVAGEPLIGDLAEYSPSSADARS